jgi:hypothetical protein
MGHRLLGFGTILLLVAACEDPASPSTYVVADALGEVHVAFFSEPEEWSGDPLQIDSARVAGDVLHVFATHGGGCEDHAYAAVAWNGWLESNPVQVGVLIAHDDHDDPCDALLFPELRFDLGPLKRAYEESYGGWGSSSVLILRLTDVGGVGGEPTLVEYAF